MTLAERIAAARKQLQAAGISSDSSAHDAEYLARHALGWDRARLVASLRDPVPTDLDPAYAALLDRRLQREPASQIVGVKEFWGLEFEVSRDVLTPRPETELIVQAALDVVRNPSAVVHRPSSAGTTEAENERAAPTIVEVGTGSGCIAVALAVELPAARVIASEISSDALAVARRNAARHGVAQRIEFLHTSEIPPARGVDILVSNPPYIPAAVRPSLPPEVRDYEPGVALFGGVDGLDFYRRLLAATDAFGVGGGWLIVEVGYDQADTVAGLASSARRPDGTGAAWEQGRTSCDLQDIERVLTFRCRPY